MSIEDSVMRGAVMVTGGRVSNCHFIFMLLVVGNRVRDEEYTSRM